MGVSLNNSMQKDTTPSTTATAPPLLTTLHDGRPGVRTLVQIETRDPDGGGLATAGSTAVLDFISSTATLDRYHEPGTIFPIRGCRTSRSVMAENVLDWHFE